MIDVFTKVVLSGVCFFTFAWVILAQRRTIKRLSDVYLRLTHIQRVLVALAVIVCTVYAQKPSTNDVNGVSGTNDVEIVEGGDTNGVDVVEGGDMNGVGGIVLNAPQPMSNGAAFLGGCGALGTVRPTVAVRPYRLESVSTHEDYSYAMPSEGAVRGTWHLTGTYEDVQKVALDGFAFPLGSDLCTSLWAYTWGKVRPQLKNASNEIAAVGAPISAIPDVSRFWTALTLNGTYLLTWENFAAGRLPVPATRDASGTVSAQIELFRNGDFITRSNDVEKVYRRVIEPNPIVDPINPPDPVDPSKSLYPYGPVQNLSVIEETNAYCWVDIVVNTADAWVRFEGDGTSNLADPSFAAKAGETNHVVILIGKTYKVMCDMPFTVVGKSDSSIDEWWEDGNTLWLNWPVNIWSVGDDEEPPLLLMSFGNGSPRRKGFTMFVSPSGLGGGFTWTNCCCSVSGSGYYFSYNCNADCSCGGCAASGYFSYEGYRLPAWGGSCGCGSPEEPHDPHDDPDDPPVPVGVSASFSKRVIFLENEYANTTNEVVPWYSDTSSLCCTAWGGENGGHVSISIVGDSNLIQYGGQPFPIERDLEPYEVFAFTNTYKAVSESSGYEAIVVTATFDENDTGWSETSIAKATAVRVEVEPHVGREGCPNRHVLGVREQIGVKTHPADVATIELSDAWLYEQEDGDTGYRCPASAMQGGLTVKVDGCNYEPSLGVIEPVGIVCHRGWVRRFGAARGSAGGIGMSLDLTIIPESVSFTGLAFVEVPSEDGSRNGYFTNSIFASSQSHTEDNEAGTWYKISPDNHFFDDCPRMERTCPQPWYDGEIIWEIPIAWGRRESRNLVDRLGNVNGYQQIFTIDSFGGVRIDKFENWVKRMPNDDVTHSPGIIEVQ